MFCCQLPLMCGCLDLCAARPLSCSPLQRCPCTPEPRFQIIRGNCIVIVIEGLQAESLKKEVEQVGCARPSTGTHRLTEAHMHSWFGQCDNGSLTAVYSPL